jgi:ubiquinone/menaquinone biosynthesis C-methylase UbiE/alkylhydroperoxidase/carboxymuconolactone decarboxylase family protein YurZ/uncharacterized protein YbaR (Trm112 family)
MRIADVAALACPICREPLEFRSWGSPAPAFGARAPDEIESGRLVCRGCGRKWPVQAGLAHLYDEAEVRGLDYLLRFVYDRIAPLHDAAVRFVLPVLQLSSARTTRDGYMRRLDLGSLEPREKGAALRILEVGVGAGANLPLIERDLPKDLDVEVWGVDLSEGMIEQCRRRLARHSGRRVRLLLADAHALPFPDASFDRVFHVGGIAGYRDPRKGLAEMARVARPGTPIVVVDEQLDPRESRCLYHQLLFRAITLYDPAPHAPREHLPPEATGVVEEQVSRFYYCLTFRMPPAGRAASQSGRPPAQQGGRDMDAAKMNIVKDILSETVLADLRGQYDEKEMRGVLSGFFPRVYALSLNYATAILDAFYGDLPSDLAPPPRTALSVRDRERCLIALLASRGADRNLALHIYIALMNEISPEEIAHILFLAGIYTGVDNLAKGLAAEVKVLEALRTLVVEGLPHRAGHVAVRLATEFGA